MFDFEKLIAYQKAKETFRYLERNIVPKLQNKFLKDQMQRASMSIVLNIAEGAGKIGKKDRCNFYSIARGSTYECTSILDLAIANENVNEAKAKLLEVSRLLSGLIIVLMKDK